MLTFAARLSLLGPLRVMDGGNRFNAYRVARALRGLERGSMSRALARISLARAFTCYQMASMLEQAPAAPVPMLVIDFLDTFYDQSVPLVERRRLLGRCLERLQDLSLRAAVVISLRPPRPPQTDPTGLQQAVQAAADQVWFQEELQPVAPLRLF